MFEWEWFTLSDNVELETANKEINYLSDINNKTAEGRLLIMALSKLSSTVFSDKTIEEILDTLNLKAGTMNWN